MDRERIIKNMTPWSISKAKVAKQCPQRFHWYYVQGKKEIPRDKIAHSAGRIGGSIHRALEVLLKEDDLSIKRAIERGAGYGDRKDRLTYDETIEACKYSDSIEHFLDLFEDWTENKVNTQEIMIEKEAAITKDLSPCDWWDDDNGFFRSIWDIGVILEHGGQKKLVIIDHKTGTPKDLEEYQAQLRSYLITAYVHFPDIAGAQPALHWLKKPNDNSIDWGEYYTRKEIDEYIKPWFFEFIEEARQSVLESTEPKEDYWCNFCPFKYRCPRKQ